MSSQIVFVNEGVKKIFDQFLRTAWQQVNWYVGLAMLDGSETYENSMGDLYTKYLAINQNTELLWGAVGLEGTNVMKAEYPSYGITNTGGSTVSYNGLIFVFRLVDTYYAVAFAKITPGTLAPGATLSLGTKFTLESKYLTTP